MSSRKPGFIGACVNGKASLDEIDDYVEAWHRQPADMELHAFLGMSTEEYGLWVADPDALTRIVCSRRNGEALPNAPRAKIGAF